jgi:hypothetical protein
VYLTDPKECSKVDNMDTTTLSEESDWLRSVAQELERFTTLTSIEARRWFVNRVILSRSHKSALAQLDPPNSLVQAAKGFAPTPEHKGIAARLLFSHMNRRVDILDPLPALDSPRSWNSPKEITNLLLLCYEPWNSFRFDPRTETLQVALSNGQWAFHLKGKESENAITLRVQGMLHDLRSYEFSTLAQNLIDQGLIDHISLEDPELAAKQLAGCSVNLDKFLNNPKSVKEVCDQLERLPIMMFDTGTVNCMQNLIAFGNGVVPTEDIMEITDTSDDLLFPAGQLVPPNIEFCLSSATGLAWPENKSFTDLIEYRHRIHYGLTEETWGDWMDTATMYADRLLQLAAPTYKKFLDHAFPHGLDTPPTERDAFLRLLGAAVFGTNLKILAAFIGAPNAGKDTVIKWLSYLLGGGQVGVLSPLALTAHADDQRAFAPLKGARLAVVSGEIGEGRSSAFLAEKVKSITSGGGTLTVAEKYEKPTTIFFDGMLIMQGNSVPTIQGGDAALYRNRLVAVEFKHPFPLSSKNYETAYRREAANFLQVLFLYYLDYMDKGGGMAGIRPPQEWQQFSQTIQANADSLSVIDRCLTQPDRATEIPSSDFYKALSILTQDSLGLKNPPSAQRWSARLRRAGVNLSREAGNPWQTRVNRADYKGWMFHFTLDASNSDGLFTDRDWTNALQSASVRSNTRP